MHTHTYPHWDYFFLIKCPGVILLLLVLKDVFCSRGTLPCCMPKLSLTSAWMLQSWVICFSPFFPYLSYSTLSFSSPFLSCFFDSIYPCVSFSGPTTPPFSFSHRWSSLDAELSYTELPFSGRWETLLLEISS